MVDVESNEGKCEYRVVMLNNLFLGKKIILGKGNYLFKNSNKCIFNYSSI